MIELHIHPDVDCRKCYGRGFAGKDTVSGRLTYCRCVKRKIHEELRVTGMLKDGLEVRVNLVKHDTPES